MDSFWLHEPGITSERLRQILDARGIRGLIVAGMQNDGVLPGSEAESWARFTSVVVGMRLQTPALHFTANDQFLTARRAVEELRRLGYERIGLVLDQRIDAWLEDRFDAGFYSGVQPRPENFSPFSTFEMTRARPSRIGIEQTGRTQF